MMIIKYLVCKLYAVNHHCLFVYTAIHSFLFFSSTSNFGTIYNEIWRKHAKNDWNDRNNHL